MSSSKVLDVLHAFSVVASIHIIARIVVAIERVLTEAQVVVLAKRVGIARYQIRESPFTKSMSTVIKLEDNKFTFRLPKMHWQVTLKFHTEDSGGVIFVYVIDLRKDDLPRDMLITCRCGQKAQLQPISNLIERFEPLGTMIFKIEVLHGV